MTAMRHDLNDNAAEMSVSELARSLKRTVEGAYGRVRVRGEISGFKRAASGHLYMALKDDSALLDAVCWRGTAGRLSIPPEDGLEVIAVGKITTYAARSRYQLVIESLEHTGEGALLKLLEDRRRTLAAEGLFDEGRKRPLPWLPEVIGVVTSPGGAVFRDILHRVADRFPRRVILWPTPVQGDGAAQSIAAAITGFNRLTPGGALPRPDLLIVARGGGSLEDLWAFNEEITVRAAASSTIPLISAIGHETDWTLIDHAADRRAPTPTAAAEMAVPVRTDLLHGVEDAGRRAGDAARRQIERWRRDLDGLTRGLSHPGGRLETAWQRLDDLAERQDSAANRAIAARRRDLATLSAGLRTPGQLIHIKEQHYAALLHRLLRAPAQLIEARTRQLDAGARALQPGIRGMLRGAFGRFRDGHFADRLRVHQHGRLARTASELDKNHRLLESLGYRNVLQRGFALVRDPHDRPVKRAAQLADGMALTLEFSDGLRGARITDAAGPQPKPERSDSTPPPPPGKQDRLL